MFAAITPVLVFIAFILLLLVSLSVPIIKSIYLFRLIANVEEGILRTGASGSVKFGVWGHCVSAIEVSVVGINHSTKAECSKPHLGYTFDKTVAQALHVSGFDNLISRTSTAALVLHPIVAGLTFLTLLISLFILRRGSNGTSRLPSLITLGVGILTAVLATIVFLIDVILVALVRHRVHNETNGDLVLNWGNAVWMTLGATIALWAATFGACAGVCACGSRYSNRKNAAY